MQESIQSETQRISKQPIAGQVQGTLRPIIATAEFNNKEILENPQKKGQPQRLQQLKPSPEDPT